MLAHPQPAHFIPNLGLAAGLFITPIKVTAVFYYQLILIIRADRAVNDHAGPG